MPSVELLNNPSKVGKQELFAKFVRKKDFYEFKDKTEGKRFQVKGMHNRRKYDVKKSLVPIR